MRTRSPDLERDARFGVREGVAWVRHLTRDVDVSSTGFLSPVTSSRPAFP